MKEEEEEEEEVEDSESEELVGEAGERGLDDWGDCRGMKDERGRAHLNDLMVVWVKVEALRGSLGRGEGSNGTEGALLRGGERRGGARGGGRGTTRGSLD